MREYQVSYRGNRLVTKDNIIDVLNELGYRPGGEEGGLRLLTITSWYLKTDQSSGITVQHPENPTLDNPAPPKPGWHLGFILPDSTYRYVWKFSDYHYGDPDHEEIEGFHVYTDCELVSIYSSPDTSMGIDFIYTLFDDTVQSVTLLDGTGDYPVTTETPLVPWTRELDTLPYGQKKYLWMSQRRIEDGDHTNWCIPIRLSGEDGSPGADGRNIEFIYKPKMNRLPDLETYPSDQPYSAGTHDQEIPNGWYNHPSGVGYFTETENGEEIEVFYRYEWASYRLRINDPPDSIKWNAWSPPIVWSAYGEKGMDGDGVEYVYMRNETYAANPPASPSFEYGNSGQTTEWRKGVYLEGDNPNNPNSWRPKDWAGTGFVRWIGGKYGPQGEWLPMLDVDGDPDDNSNYWTDDPKGVSDTYKKEWVSQRKYVNGSWGTFSPPKVWSTFSKEHTVEIIDGEWWIDGENQHIKAEGENGKGIDLKGRVDFLDSDHETRFMQENPDFSFEPGHVVTYLKDVDDETSDDFRDPEVGDCYVVTYNGHIYLYIGGDDEDWKKHWHDFGEFQGEGAYVHIAWAETITIEDGHVHSSGFVLDKELSDNIAGLDWMGIYTDNKINDSRDEDDYKWNYLRGRDGDDVERVYIRTAIEVTPEIEYTVQPGDVRVYPEYPADGVTKTYQSQEYLPFVANPVDDDTVNPPIVGCQPDGGAYVDSLEKFQFTDDPLGVTSTLPYEWMAERKKRDGEWKYFSVPSLHATYSHNGQSIIRSTIFRRWDRLDQAPQRPAPTFGSYEYPAGEIADPDWKDGIPSGTGAIWKSERVFTSDTRPPQWDNWSIPTLVQDDDNYDVELSIQARNTTPVPPVKYDEATTTNRCNSHHPAEGEEGYNPNIIADQQLWFDPVLDANYITENNKNFNWMATRTKYVNSSNLPAWRPWTIVLIKGEDGGTGPAGIGFQHAYIVITGNKVPNIKVNPEDSTEFISDVSGATGTWQLDTTNGLIVGPGQYLWMAERTVQSGVYGLWGDPVKISGEGTPGEDAEDIEFVYKQENRLPNNTSQNSDVPGNTTYTDINGKEQVYANDDYIPQGWTDSPLGVSTEFKYEWMCQRIKPRTGDIDDPDNPWGPWSNVFVWSAYGDTGMDGDGVEYIFTVDSTLSSSIPASPKYKIGNSNTEYDWAGEVVNTAASGQTPIWKPKGEDLNLTYTWTGGGYNLQGEWIPTGWSDEPHGVGYFDEDGTEVLYSYEWVSIRKRISGEWKEFSPPSLWSNFSKRQTLTIGDDGYWYDEDGNQLGRAEGEAGKGIELKDTLDVKFNCDKHSYAVENGISDETTVKSLQDVHPTSRTDTTSQYKDIQPGDCYVVKQTRHLYVCRFNKSNWDFTDNASTIDDDTWDANKNWSDVGEFLGKGSYMHIAWAASKDPKREIQGDNIVFNEGTGTIKWIKYFVTAYENKLPNVDYDWMGVYSDYDQLDPPSNFDLTANDGTTTDGKALNSSLYKWNNVRGRDGDNYERVYVKSKGEGSGYKPQLPSTYESYDDPETGLSVTFQDPEYRPVVANYVEGENPPRFSHTRFTDDPTGVSEDYPYEWMCERKKKLNTTTHQVEWFPFSPPALWAKYSFDGQHGNSIQVAYAIAGSTLTITDKTGNLPISTGITWYSTTTGLVPGDNQYLWMSQRVGFTGNWGLWEDPIRLSGQDGKPGEDGADIEFIYLRNNDSTAPSSPANPTAKKGNKTVPYYGDVEKINNVWTPTSWDTTNNDQWSNEWSWINGLWNNDGEWIPTGWSDNPSGVDSTHKYEWACQRTKSSGNNQSWTQWVGPFKWSAYGDTGMDGDGVEYVYYRYQGSGVLRKPSGPMALTSTHPNDGIEWNGGIINVGSSSTPDWQPKNWDSSNGKGDFDAWDQDYGYFNEQGEWIPRVYDSLGTNLNPTYWSDDPKGVGYFDENNDGVNEKLYLYEYVSVRKRTNGVWGEFSDPKIWASWGTDIYIDNGVWIINGVPSGKAEGEDGKGIALKGSVDFLTRKELEDYKTENAGVIPQTELNKLRALQQIQPNDPYNLGITSVEVGDCYVVRKNRYLYTSKKRFDTDSNTTDDWDTSPGQTAVNNLWWVSGDNPGVGQINWAEIGEFQGADGENNYLHIAWAPASSVKFEDPEDPGKITLVHPFICDYAELDQEINYEWMGICKSDDINDPADNCNDDGTIKNGTGTVANWTLYSWNHVKGRDGSDYERVYIRTSKYDPNNPPLVTDAYSSDLSSAYQQPEFRPYVSNPSACGAEGSSTTPVTYRFTDDPKGVSANFPYEWISERHKTLDNSTLKMLWGRFTAPALWSTYSFDGMTAGLSKETDIIIIDAVGNPVGGIGDSSNPRFYTEVKIYDPRLNNGVGGYLEYQSSGTVQEGKYRVTSVTRTPNDDTNFTHNITPSGKIYISKLGDSNEWRKTTNECKLDINVTIYGGRTFSFPYTLALSHSPQTYLTYNLTNDLDIFTYRTRTSTYDGLPITTCLETWTNDGNSDKLNDNTTKNSGYIKSVKVVGIAGGFLRYIKVGGNKVTNRTVEATSTVDDSTGVVTYNTVTATIYSNSACTTATGLYLDVKSDGTVTLRKSGSSFVDLADTSHDLDISCIAVYGGVEYTSPTKTFSLSEKNDATLYKLVPSDTSITKNEDGSYTPSSISVQVAVSDETGTSNKTPGTAGLIPGTSNIYVKYQNPSVNDNLLDSCPSFSDVSSFFRILIVQNPSGTTPIYHDRQTVQINKPGISQTYVDLSTDKFIINCDKDGKILGTTDINYSVLARLMWGDQECVIDTDDNNCSMTPTGFSWILNNPSSTSRVCNASVGWNNTYSPPRYAGSFNFHPNKTLNSGTITIYMEGTFADGVTRHATETITVEASRQGIQGPEGDRGDFKSTAFIRTETDISNYTPVGGDYDDPIPEGFVDNNDQEVQGITETWQDGIPEGKKKLWASTCTFYGNDYPNGSSGWSSPREMLDTPEYDVEFAYQQPNGDPPVDPVDGDSGNRHRDSDPYGYTGQVWFDPQKDKHKGNATTDRDFNNMYWRAERERVNEGTWSPWVITQIKGESEPSIQAVPDIFVIETDPTGKLSQDRNINFTTKLFSGNQIQTPTIGSGTKIEYVEFEEGSTSTITYLSTNTAHASFNSTTKAITWAITIPGNETLQDSSIKVTMKNSYCSDTTNIPVTIKRLNRSSFKSFVFKRFASTPSASDAPSTTATGGSYENNGLPTGTSGRDSGWSDGLPADGGTDPIYMSSRTFYSDGQPSNDSWSVPIKMSDTDLFNVEFSPQNSQPAAPNGSNQNGGSGTQIWFDPVLDKYTDSAHTTLRDFTQMKWMATSTSKDNNGNWTNWVVVRIKGETGESQHIDNTDAYYKIFNTLDVQMPADDDEEGLAAWTTTQIEPTEELPYLWRFFRTEYSNPYRAENYGLELVQVWSENMINPNLLDNPDFDVEDVRPNGLVWPYSGTSDAGGTMGAWTTWQVSNTQFWTSWGKNYGLGSNYPEVGPENGYNYYGGIHDVNTNLSGTGYVVVLKQFIYKKEDSTFINKVSAGNWYTLSFWMKGFSNFHDDSLQVKILSKNSSNTNSSGTGLLDNTSSNKVYVNNTAYATSTSIISFSYSNTLSYNKFNSSWNKYTITFKIKDSIPNDVITCHIEWTLSVSNPATKKGGILLSKPKLEVGKLATRYISSRIKDPYPRVTEWKVGEMYYQGRYGEPYLDIVSYEGQWFRCRLTHISNDGICTSSGHLGEYNSSVDFRPIVGTTNTWWEPANNFDFISTNLLLAETAFIKNLTVGGLRTDDMGKPHVEMIGSNINFYGRANFPNIKMNVDEDNMAYLEFYDKNNTFLYDLGPSGIRWKVTVTSASCIQNTSLVKTTATDNNSLPKPDFIRGGTVDTSLWRFSPAREDGVIVGDPNYTKNDDNIANKANGKYFTSTTFVKQENGSWILDESKYANYMYRRQDEPVDTLSTNLGNYSASTINNAIQNWKDDLVMFWNFPSGSINEINAAYTVNNNIATITYPVYRQVYINIVNGFSNTFYAFKQQNTIWMVLA